MKIPNLVGSLLYVPRIPPLVKIRLRQSQESIRAQNSVFYRIGLNSPNLSEEAMHLATRIVEIEPEPNSVHLRFNGVENSPELLSTEGFCSFVRLLNVALPMWPHFLFADDSVQPCIFLASMNQLWVTKLAIENLWVVTVKRDTLESEMRSMTARLARVLPPHEVAKCIASLAQALGQCSMGPGNSPPL